jgi:cysteine synthase A
MRNVKSILELIGHTPNQELSRVTDGSGVRVWAKLEMLNPSGSLKDRIALQMIEDAEQSGQLKKEDTIIESSSGNTAIALSFVGGIKGYRRIIFLPRIVAQEKVTIITRYGAETRIVQGGEDLKNTSAHGAYVEVPGRIMCKEMEEKTPHVWWARQFSNPSNWRAHMNLGREILEQMAEGIDAFVASVGTGGTVFGVGRILKEADASIRVVAVEPAESQMVTLTHFEVIEGVTGGILQEIKDSDVVDDIIRVTDNDAIRMRRRLIEEEGLFVGVSAGANVEAALRVGRDMGKGARVVTVLPDRGDRYITSEHYVT